MVQKTLMSQLKLSHCPLSTRDFAKLNKDPTLQKNLKKSSIYIIAQRPILKFDNLVFQNDIIKFDITQKNNPLKVSCSLPMPVQYHNFNLSNIGIGSLDKKTDLNIQPTQNIHEIRFYYKDKLNNKIERWITPEKFIFDYSQKGTLQGLVGNIQNITKYKVLYVGESTKQDVWKRLATHHKLPSILSLEDPISEDSLLSNEIVLLFFHFEEKIEIQANYSIKDTPYQPSPNNRKVYLDSEKALIKAMNPEYNTELFKNYPKSTNGLYDEKFSSIYYHFGDPLTLVYEKGKIKGDFNYKTGDVIKIIKGKPISIGRLEE
jgi:hypothetical protein